MKYFAIPHRLVVALESSKFRAHLTYCFALEREESFRSLDWMRYGWRCDDFNEFMQIHVEFIWCNQTVRN